MNVESSPVGRARAPRSDLCALFLKSVTTVGSGGGESKILSISLVSTRETRDVTCYVSTTAEHDMGHDRTRPIEYLSR